MSIDLTDRTIGLWFVQLNKESDWLGSIWATDEGYGLTYRFRYYVDDKTFDSKDTKNWYSAEISKDHTTEDEIVSHMREVVKLLWVSSGGKRYEIMMGSGGVDELMAELEKMPFTSMKTNLVDTGELG